MANPREVQEAYDILLIGKTGYGKSTTGNKLLGISEGVAESEAAVKNEVERFDTGVGSESVTTKCKLLSNDRNVRVLDTPGFGNTQLTKRLGSNKCNQQILRLVQQEQEERNLAFRRVVYFLPKRGPLEREEGTLQDEIRVMYEFWGDDIFNIMVVVATNSKRRQTVEFDKEDFSTTKKVFTAVLQTMTDKHLKKCPPIVYLPLDEAEPLIKIKSAKVISDKAWIGKAIKKEKSLEEPPKQEKSLNGEASQMKEKPEILPGPLKTETEIKAVQPTKSEAVEHPPSTLGEPDKHAKPNFESKCIKCGEEILYKTSLEERESGDKGKIKAPDKQNKCHPLFITTQTYEKNCVEDVLHVTIKCSKICPVCERPCGTIGCTDVGQKVIIHSGNEEKQHIETSHDNTPQE